MNATYNNGTTNKIKTHPTGRNKSEHTCVTCRLILEQTPVGLGFRTSLFSVSPHLRSMDLFETDQTNGDPFFEPGLLLEEVSTYSVGGE